MNQPAYTRIPFAPIADPAAVVHAGQARFTVLTPRLIRMEYCPDGRFEDRPSQAFWYRRQPVPAFTVTPSGGGVRLTTDHLELAYHGGPFTAAGLSVKLLDEDVIWRFGDVDSGNLRGTARTLDKVSGATSLSTGLLSRSGWTVVDDSESMVFNGDGWLEARGAGAGGYDGYFFGYGRSYRQCLRDFARVAGDAPLLPRWALGNWWSRYWAYSQDELTGLMAAFRQHDVPLSVCIVDMDWHLVDVGPGVNGWTGYTWNRALFPDPPAFIRWLHEQGLKTALNLHPALGVRPHEEMYSEMAHRLGLDAEAGGDIPFDCVDPDFIRAYFEVLHHPQEADGVDFWWLDWQQGERTKLAGLDPLWWLNHLHFYDLGRDGKRPFIFSRWGGLGNHRYPIGFSGDTHITWASLAFQPYFTATAANVGYGWWSHDIGGHMQGVEDPELYTRWVQFGLFSPILRLHSTNNRFHERRPWGYDAEVFRVTRDAMQLRHALIPYLYTQSWLNTETAVAPVRPLYHDYPDEEAAYHCPQAYLFGGDLLVAPYVEPADSDTRLSRQVFWLPPGDWYHFFDGEHFSGCRWYARYGKLDDVPVFARAGAIIPLGPRAGWGGVGVPETLHVHCFAGADGRFTLYEDDGETMTYREGRHALTTFELAWQDAQLTVSIAPVEGDRAVVPERRCYTLHLHGLAAPGMIEAQVNGWPEAVEVRYEATREALSIEGIELAPAEGLQVVVRAAEGGALRSRRDRTAETVLSMLESFRLHSLAKAAISRRANKLRDDPCLLADFGVDLAPSQARALLEITQDTGAHVVRDLGRPALIVLWNNNDSGAFSYHYAALNEDKWHESERYAGERGTIPPFRAIIPGPGRWALAADYAGLASFTASGEG